MNARSITGADMSDNENYHDARRMLIELLAQPNDLPVDGVELLSAGDRLFLLTTCAATIIEQATCHIAGHRRELALEGLDALVVSMRQHIEALCNEKVCH